MENIIRAAVERGASDLHIKAGDVFRARIDGQLQPLTKHRLTPEQTKAIAMRFIPNDADRKAIDNLKDYDCSWGAPGIGRFRVNILRQRSSFMVVLRVIPFEVPTIEKLQLPNAIERLAVQDRGMVLVTGGTGTGKTSTMAAMVHHINSSLNKHIVTLESPIEFLHRDLNSSVTQREIGVDTEAFEVGLHAALRQDPDVVLIDELRDAVMVDTAMKSAETGHLLISALTTPDAATTIARVVAMFPADEQEIARMRLADVLLAVVSQRLLPRTDGQGRCVAVEILVATPEVQELIRRNHMEDIRDVISDGAEHEMQTLEQHLFELVSNGVVTEDTALAAAAHPPELQRALGKALSKTVKRGTARKRKRGSTKRAGKSTKRRS